MLQRFWRWLFPPTPIPIDPHQEAQVTGEVRQAQQRLASATRLVEMKAHKNARRAQQLASEINHRVQTKEASVRAAENALNALRREARSDDEE